MPAAFRRPDHYSILGLTVDATDDDIRAAYKKMALQWHPDRHLTGKEHAAQMFVEVNSAYHSLMDGTESTDPSCGDRASPSFTPTETGTVRSSSVEPNPQALNTQASRRTTSSGSQNSAQAPNPFPSASVHSSDTEKLSQPRSSDDKPTHHASHDHHFNPKHHFPKSSSTGSNGSRSRSRSRTKSYDNLRGSPRSATPVQPPSSTTSAGRSRSSHTSNISPLKSHDNLRDLSRNTRESQSGQVPPLAACGDSKSDTSTRSKNNQGAGPTFTYSKGRSDGKLSRSQTGNFSQPVIPPPSSKLHKLSRLGLREELLQKLSKGSSKGRKEECPSYSDHAPTYGSPLRALGAPRGASKEWLFPLPLTLDEMYHGTTYQFLVTRELLSRKTEQVEICIEVPPGIRSGTRIICPRTGHQRKDGTLQDVIFLVEEVPDGRFTRVKDDLFMDICVPWVESLAERGGDVCIDGMDGDDITFALPYPIYDKSTEGQILVKGAGMPIREGRKTVGRGDLIVRWQVVFSHPSKWDTFKKVLRIKV
ncbi:uncharacterized protein EDB91DRAFT_397116 [Suillus paluster]|uniref:uncharacterized protein n=1 Tax=Suillus paluster TaxID=48578 RepID=UPI001B873A0F|nr:uncharacterized protein EDB91DRAFT_397116 [Suillus paluster]KAG1739184.1 hypothetical protein EDB91DRAFT_397116 [Suillus paluster]